MKSKILGQKCAKVLRLHMARVILGHSRDGKPALVGVNERWGDGVAWFAQVGTFSDSPNSVLSEPAHEMESGQEQI